MLVTFAVDCVVSRIEGCFFFLFLFSFSSFLNLRLDDLLFLPWYKVTANV